jgi:2-deoxy-D-gluconate 3-dehydrogenase
MTNLFDLTGRTAVVTGSAQAMGRAMAIALAEAGADLVLLDRSQKG